MPRPFNEFSSNDMKLIYKEMLDYVEKLDGIAGVDLYHLPDLINTHDTLHFDKNDEYGIMLFKRAGGAEASINVSKDYQVVCYDIDDDTKKHIEGITTKYLKTKGFI